MHRLRHGVWLRVLLAGTLLLGAGGWPGGGASVAAQGGVRVFEIQGAAHVSPLAGRIVADVPGVVTALRSNGFYLQDAEGDGRAETTDGILVFTRSAPTVAVGDSVRVSGPVREFRPGNDEANLTTTEIELLALTVEAREQPLPPPVVLGPSGRQAPMRVVAEGAIGDMEAMPELRPDASALDFFESLEGMRIQIEDAVVVGPRAGPAQLPVLPEDGAGVARRTLRGGLLAAPSGEAPPRIVLTDGEVRVPPTSVGDRFPGRIVGVVEYAFGGYRVRVSELPALVLGSVEAERAAPAPEGALSVATFNVENLSARERPAKLAALAERVIEGLGGPDLLVLQEIQDDTGAADDGIVTGGRSAGALSAAIRAAGGPSYEYREVPGEDNQDGGEPGANIRVGFLFRTDRGLAFVDRPASAANGAADGTDAMMPATIVQDERGPHLAASPARLEPGNPAWTDSRKPLVGEFTFGGRRIFVVGCHFASKRGDGPEFGRFQPPARPSEPRRVEQARLVNAFAGALLAADPSAHLIVLGDLNDVPESATLSALTDGPLANLLEQLPEDDRYSYVFGGQSEAIDHILVSPSLLAATSEVDAVHGNAEMVGAPSDHDPVLVRFVLPPR